MTRLWDQSGKKQTSLDQAVLNYSAGDDHLLDERLVSFDLQASQAHAAMLQGAGYLSEKDFLAITKAMSELAASHEKHEWHILLEEEDCHTAIENRLVQMVGEPGLAIHLGRSRNDQVLAALRLYLKEALTELAFRAENVALALDAMVARDGALPMVGYTHMQRAMPSTVGLWAGAFAAELRDDAEGLRAARRRADKNPLGSAAGFGVPVVKLSRETTRAKLNFAINQEPVTAVQLSRGKAEATALFEATLLAQDFGRLAADLCLFSTSELGFVRLPVSMTTGSSIMPNKRNPDVFELARGRTGEAQAALQEVLAISAKMTSGYHRDLQLVKRPLFRGLDSVFATAEILAHAVPQLTWDEARLRSALEPQIYATEQAYRLVAEQHIPFREAYRRVKEGLG